MAFSLSNWRSRHLLAAWIGYWVSLGLVTLAPALSAISRVTGPGDNGSISLNGGNQGLALTVTEQAGRVLWSGSVSLGAIAFWTIGPPLMLWLAWLLKRAAPSPGESRQSGHVDAMPNADARAALGEGAAEPLASSRRQPDEERMTPRD
jgi:hypothetical protein